ncbi:hypothetical protein FQZ97_686170 [compost metagenome]
MGDDQGAIVLFLDDGHLGDGQLDGQVHLVAVQDVGLEGDGVLAVRVVRQVALVFHDPGQQRDGDSVGVAGELQQDDVEGVAVLEGQGVGPRPAKGAGVQENPQAIGVVPQLAHGRHQVLFEGLGLVHGWNSQ